MYSIVNLLSIFEEFEYCYALLFGLVLLFSLIVSPLAGMSPASAQETTPTAPSSAQPDDVDMVPITDPWVDPTATLDDAFFLSFEEEPLASEISGTTALQPGEYQFLPADVALTEFYAELYYETPALPDGASLRWDSVSGSRSMAVATTSACSPTPPATLLCFRLCAGGGRLSDADTVGSGGR